MFLTKAYICINCEWLGEDCMGCEKCGSREVMPLTQWFKPALSDKQRISLFDAMNQGGSKAMMLLEDAKSHNPFCIFVAIQAEDISKP